MRGNNLDSVRRNNLSMVVELVHRERAISRSQLTRATGLNRSTVAALVAELADLELIVESNPDATATVGRPSPIVSPHSAPVAIAVNPELDAITVGIVSLGGAVLHRVRHEVDHAVTAREAATVIGDIVATFTDQLEGKSVTSLGLAIPGLVRANDGVVRWAPHLDWTDESIIELVAATTNLTVVAANDASLGATAEHLFGAGRGVNDLVYLNGGASGIGGGVIANGALLGGVGGYAGEFGQNRPGFGDAGDRTTVNGTLEDEVSRSRLLSVLDLHSADETELAEALATASNPAVRAEVERQSRILSVALSNAVNVLNPQLVVLGGFLSALLAVNADEISARVAEQSVAAVFADAQIVPAALGVDRLMIGAAELAFESLIADPSGSRG